MKKLKALLHKKPSFESKGINSGSVEPPASPSREEILSGMKFPRFWYHRIYLGKGVYTIDNQAYHEEVWAHLEPVFPRDLGGASVLDIGCNAGYFSLQTKFGGAGRVLGLDPDPEWLEQAEFCKKIWNLDVEYAPLDAHHLHEISEPFDLVIFAGLLYHLKNPLSVLEEVARICQNTIILESEIIPPNPRNRVLVRQGVNESLKITACHSGIMKFIEKDELNGDGSNWWVPDTECVLGMLRTVGFSYFSPPVYLTKFRLLLVASKNRESLLNYSAFR